MSANTENWEKGFGLNEMRMQDRNENGKNKTKNKNLSAYNILKTNGKTNKQKKDEKKTPNRQR